MAKREINKKSYTWKIICDKEKMNIPNLSDVYQKYYAVYSQILNRKNENINKE